MAYDSAARFNEMLIGTIDAIDTALTATLAGDIALAVFVIDKIADLQSLAKLAAVLLLCASIVAAVAGYLFRFRSGAVDGLRPLLLISDLSNRGPEAVLSAIDLLVSAGERNLLLRFVKRIVAALAILCLVCAVVVLAVARLTLPVVH